MTIAIPLLERMAKEGEEGRKKIATITRYVTVILGLIQGVASTSTCAARALWNTPTALPVCSLPSSSC